jgi:hypothetical protein
MVSQLPPCGFMYCSGYTKNDQVLPQ